MVKKENLVITSDLRKELKKLYARELPKLPEYFNMLQPAKKMEFLLRFAPYVLPRVDSVSHRNGETNPTNGVLKDFEVDIYG